MVMGRLTALVTVSLLLPEKLLSLGGTAAVFPGAILAAFSHWCEPPTKIFGSLICVWVALKKRG